MVTTFYFVSNDPLFVKSIHIDEKTCATIEDLKKQFADQMNFDQDSFIINDVPKKQKISLIKNNTKLRITFQNRCTDIEFNLPNGTQVRIPNSYKMNFSQIIEYLKQKNIFYSPLCIKNNLHAKISGKDILYDKYPFAAVGPDSKVEIYLIDKFVSFQYAGKEFSFCENETVDTVRYLISKAFKEVTHQAFISIRNAITDETYKYNYKIKSDKKYLVNIIHFYVFKNISIGHYFTSQKMDLSSTVNDAQKRLSIIFCDKEELRPKNIIIYDKSKQKVTDRNILLRNICENDRVYFEIDRSIKYTEEEKSLNKKAGSNPPNKKKIKLAKPKLISADSSKLESHRSEPKIVKPVLVSCSDDDDDDDDSEKTSIEINFEFEESDERKFKPFKQKVQLSTTIAELDEKISKKYGIDKQIIIQYKFKNNKVSIDGNMTIEDILDDIKVKNSNILYIKITENPKQTKTKEKKQVKVSKIKPKTKPVPVDVVRKNKKIVNSSDDDDEDSSNTKQTYTFEFNEKEKKMKFIPSTYLQDHVIEIKEKFEIDSKKQIEFIVSRKGRKEEKLGKDDKRTMKSLKDSVIKISMVTKSIRIKPKITKTVSSDDDDDDSKKKSSSDDDDLKKKSSSDDDDDDDEEVVVKPKQKPVDGKYKYYYQTNNDDEVKEIELKEGTSVKQFKEIIGKENDVDNLANIKVIFAGKDLLNDIILDELNVGDTILFIYIRTEQDIFLMTAKALKVGGT